MMAYDNQNQINKNISNINKIPNGVGQQACSMVNFTDHDKMSPSLVELRIDYHLIRIMKSYRLNNFANSIKAMPLKSRIFEKLIEILVR